MIEAKRRALALLIAERDENECRLDMKPSERVALGRRLEELERPKAQERRADGAAVRVSLVLKTLQNKRAAALATSSARRYGTTGKHF